MPEAAVAEFVIEGVTVDGKAFRPSDWAQRTEFARLLRPGEPR